MREVWATPARAWPKHVPAPSIDAGGPANLAGEPLLHVLAQPIVGSELPVLGRQAISSAFHFATDARYASLPARMAVATQLH